MTRATDCDNDDDRVSMALERLDITSSRTNIYPSLERIKYAYEEGENGTEPAILTAVLDGGEIVICNCGFYETAAHNIV